MRSGARLRVRIENSVQESEEVGSMTCRSSRNNAWMRCSVGLGYMVRSSLLVVLGGLDDA